MLFRLVPLPDDVSAQTDLVSLVAVLDPLADHDEQRLRRVFPDPLRPFKRHYVVDLGIAADQRTSSHHRRNVIRAARSLDVRFVDDAGRRG